MMPLKKEDDSYVCSMCKAVYYEEKEVSE